MKRMQEPSLREGFERVLAVDAREPSEFVVAERVSGGVVADPSRPAP